MDRVRPVGPPSVERTLSGFSSKITRLNRFQRQGFYIDAVGHPLVGHDCGGVGIDQNDLKTLLLEAPAGLRPGVVEFGGLTYD
jgi:hypothetical protein